MSSHRFAADIMLGRLATWLRLLGLDTAYGSHLSGTALVRLARREQRIILTRDRRLARQRGLPLLFIDSDHFRDQVRQVVFAFGIDPLDGVFTLCVRCNARLQAIPHAEAAPRVPPYVAGTTQDFRQCPRCHRIYWPGTHHDKVRAELLGLGLAR